MKKNKIISVIISVFIVLLVSFSLYVYEELTNNNSIFSYYETFGGDRKEIKIPANSEIDDVIHLLNKNGELHCLPCFNALAYKKGYTKNIISGTIILEGRYSINSLINSLKVKKRDVGNLQIPENIRLIEDMIILIEDSIGYKRGELKSYLDTSNFLIANNWTMETLPAFFIPNTYELYTDVSVEEFLNKMNEEYKKFWNTERERKCDSLGITKIDVSILASIAEEEQDKRLDERSKIAGLYLNRLKNPSHFPYLQADPTVKFANKDFGIKQVLNKHLKIDNPYNTYKYKGLPPGPICIPSIQAIDAVLNAEKHDYYFMCAGSNGDGYHEFTSTNRDHNKKKRKFKKFQGFK